VTTFWSELGAKKLELLHEVVPSAKKIAMLVNENNRVTLEADTRIAHMVSTRLRVEVVVVNAGSETEIGSAFASAAQRGIGAMFVGSDTVVFSRHEQIGALALQHKLPTMSSSREHVRSGQLMSYGTDDLDMYRQAGVYVGRILKGEKPGDLPVVQPTKFEFAINLKTAKALGLIIPQSVLAIADEVIE